MSAELPLEQTEVFLNHSAGNRVVKVLMRFESLDGELGRNLVQRTVRRLRVAEMSIVPSARYIISHAPCTSSCVLCR